MTDQERIKWIKHEIFKRMDENMDVFDLKQELLALEMKNDK